MNSTFPTDSWILYVQFGSIIIALVTALLAVFEYSRKNKLKRAGELNEIVERVWSDPDICNVIYKAEKLGLSYDATFYQTGLEYKIDKTLEYLSYFCYLKERHLISHKEFLFLEYRIRTILSNQGVQAYLYNIYHFTRRKFHESEGNQMLGKRYSIIKSPFYYLIKYADQNGLLKDGFFDFHGAYKYLIEA